MDVTLLQPWWGAVVLVVGVLVAALAWRGRRTTSVSQVQAAGVARLRALPGFAALVRAEQRARTVEVTSLGVALLGVALLVSRWVGIDDDSSEMRNRDVVLCMDVSGSMQPVVEDVLATWTQLTATFDGERVALVMFDGNAVTAFPLTDDYAYVGEALTRARGQVADADLPGVRAVRAGSSLVGDGAASCVQHFDRADEERSRTLVLATDNLVSGDQIYTLDQAVDLAVARGVMVHGIVPRENREEPTDELRTQTERTGGDVLVLDPSRSTTSVVIADSITRQQKKVMLAEARERSYDRVVPGALLLAFGLVGASVTRRRGGAA